MNIKTLQEPLKCCGSDKILWIVSKGFYMCPCGKTKIRLAPPRERTRE